MILYEINYPFFGLYMKNDGSLFWNLGTSFLLASKAADNISQKGKVSGYTPLRADIINITKKCSEARDFCFNKCVKLPKPKEI